MEKQKSPVKIKNFTINNKYGTEDVVINKNTTITPITADFEYHSQEKVLSISSLTNVAPEQLVAIKGYLAHLSATKKIIVQGSELKKQEVILQTHQDLSRSYFGEITLTKSSKDLPTSLTKSESK